MLSYESTVAVRRDLHRHPEPAWCEFRTASKVVAALRAMGWAVKFGRDVVQADARMGLPDPRELDRFYRLALESGADKDTLSALKGGYTGVVATLEGAERGPTIALRFDMDANLGQEATSDDHFPVRQGFASLNVGVHHNCGHDGHTAIGLAVAQLIADAKSSLRGRIKLIFQPAEEGLRGANAIIAAGALEGVDILVGAHIGVQARKLGLIVGGYHNILASTKIDAAFYGKGSHAAISPHEGRNALMAACVATQNLLALPRHGEGETRINVGLLSGGVSRNTIPSEAKLAAELRADTTAILTELERSAANVLQGAAQMYDVRLEVTKAGSSCAASSDDELVDMICEAAPGVEGVAEVRRIDDFKASDDVALMMDFVQKTGGKAVYFGLGSSLVHPHHNPHFDFDEQAMPIGIEIFSRALKRLGVLR